MLSCLLTVAAAAATLPQTTTPGAVLIDRNRVDRAPAIEAPTRVAPPPPATPISQDAPQVTIRGVRFTGAKAPRPVADAAKRFVGRRASRQTLSELATALSSGYAKSRVALYTVAITEQDFANGVVTVRLIEGRIATAKVKGSPRRHPLLRRRLAKLLAEQPLSRATYERQLTLIRAIPGLAVDTSFADPNSTGALVLTATPKARRTKITGGFSNRGVDLLGGGQFDLRGELYGAVADGDILSVSASTATNLRQFRYVAAGYAAPIGADGLTLSTGLAYLETRPRGYAFTGRARQATLALSYPLVRGFHRSADVSLGLDGLNSDNAVFGNLIASERTRAVRLAGSIADQRARRAVSASASLSRGLDVLGARVTRPLAKPTFAKVTGSAALNQAIGKRLVARVSASGQWTRDALPAAERFAIGGAAIGRAFDTGLLSGDRGIGGSAELAWLPIKGRRFATSELYGFVDRGAVTVLDRGALPEQRYTLASAGVGARAKYRDRAEVGLEAAYGLEDPYPGYADDWRLSVEWRLTL